MADYKEMADKEVARLAGRFPAASASEAPTLMADLPGGGVPPAAIPAAAPATAPVETVTKPRTVVPSAGVLPSALGEMTPDFGRFKKAIDVVPSLLEAGQKLSRAQSDETKAKMEGQALLAKEQASALENHAQTVRNDIAARERKLAEFPYPEFHPTKENAQSLGELFSIMSTMGVLLGGAGKLSSINALNAMGGMLKGWQAGRADLFKREKETFDKEFQRIKAIHEDLKRTFDEYMKARAVDKEAAMYKAQELATKAGANSIIAAQIKVGDYKAVADSLQAFVNLKQHLEDREAQMQLAQMREGRADERARLQREQQLEIAKTRAAGMSTKAGQNAQIFASRVYGNIENAAQDIRNINLLPKTADLPVLAGMLNVDRDTALGSISSLLARKITKKEDRAFQQVSDQLGAALARLESQGLASGGTKSAIASFNSMRPAAGDDAINMALFIARAKQEVETGVRVLSKMHGATAEQKEAAQLIVEDLNRIVPFNVEEVQTVMSRGKAPLSDKMQKLISARPVAVDLQMSPEQPAPAPAPAASPAPSPSSGLNIDEERSRAKSAIQRGAPEAEVRKRFKEATGKDL